MERQAATAKKSDFVARGVWRAPFLVDGSEAAIAVDSMKPQVGIVVLHPGVNRAEAKAMLTKVLDMVEPIPQLRIVEDDEFASDPNAIPTGRIPKKGLLAVLTRPIAAP